MHIRHYQKQKDYFYDLDTTFRLCDKGRRTGITKGAAMFFCMEGFDIVSPDEPKHYLWVDTIYGNIDRYYSKYFLPILRKYPSHLWDWKKVDKQLIINDLVIDFRSADKPESIEGFGYHKLFLNEAGIILKGDKGRYLWFNAIMPMMMDYDGCIAYIGGTPKGKRGKDGKISLFSEMCERARSNSPRDADYSITHINSDENPYLSKKMVSILREELPEGPIRDQEFYGKHVDSVSGIIKDFWFTIEDNELYGEVVRSWDLAFTEKKANDFYAGAKMSRNETEYQVQDMKHGKLHWPDLKLLIMATAELDGPEVVVILEEAGQQIGYVDELNAEPRMQNYVILGQAPVGNKLSRCMRWASRAKRGQVKFLRGEWNGPVINEGCAFTNDDSHAHDDQLDAISGAYQHFNSEQAGICFV